MVIPALFLLASSFVVAAVPPPRLVEAKKPFAVPMFHPPSATNRAVGLASLRPSLPTAKREPSLICHIIVIEADPNIDPKMAVKGPTAIDPKIVQRSACAEPVKD